MANRDFQGTDTSEWAVANHDFAPIADGPAVLQGIAVRLRMFKADCWLDESLGVPYLDEILIKGADPILVRADLREAIADTPDVTDIAAADLQIDASRNASVAYEVATRFSLNQKLPPVLIGITV